MELGSEHGYIMEPSQAPGEYDDFIGVYRKFVNKKLCIDAIAEFDKFASANNALQQGHEQFPQGKMGRQDSAFTLDDVKGVGVTIEKVSGEKCERCWKFYENIQDNNICKRCLDAIK